MKDLINALKKAPNVTDEQVKQATLFLDKLEGMTYEVKEDGSIRAFDANGNLRLKLGSLV